MVGATGRWGLGAILGGGVNRGGGAEGLQPLRTDLHIISLSISLQNSLS